MKLTSYIKIDLLLTSIRRIFTSYLDLIIIPSKNMEVVLQPIPIRVDDITNNYYIEKGNNVWKIRS